MSDLRPGTTMARIALLERQMRELALFVSAFGECDWGGCDEEASALRWDEAGGWLPVCQKHQASR